ncbi:P-loop containing nucleoside triphosphate hydrolases superfamily protein [Perilla frutescens var. hirtella]|uniref:P-loop containing nucleoside triphosphate hydrolases superfamily protein n=1 Tax=Perilla frutescens var. hirtella TaxID=608512 RepID=A0AAD4JL30_PERFH|nr:P-loop containing nucleoside triphosphate hydrolases superfamily protein [Perilla frutescens var. hirtella]
MFLTHRFPRIHSHLFTSPKPHKLFLITSTLLSKSKTPIPPPLPLPLPLSHFSTLTPTPTTTTPPQQQESLQLSLETLFIPPETDVSSLKDAPLTARILKGSNIVLSKFAGDGVDVVNAEFVKSSVKTEDCPSDRLPEFALVGRSNVGKSSLLNSLVRRKRLALTSKKPGKTQCINHFRINDSWYLVDLPGYGYAAAPHEVRTDWAKFTKDYFLNRPTLVSVFLLIDASIPAKPIDLEYASWLGQNEIPMTLVFTKCDKRKKKKNGGKRPEENVRDFQELIRDFFQTAPPWIMTSSVTNQGRDEILLHMSQLRNYWLKH